MSDTTFRLPPSSSPSTGPTFNVTTMSPENLSPLPPPSLYDASVLRSSFVPDMARSIEIRQSIASQQQFVHSIGARLLDMEREMEQLRSQHEAVSKMMEVQQGLLAPVRRLMPEILQRIFEYATGNFPTMSTTAAPHVLTQICHEWRTVAIGTPHLWRSVRIDGKLFQQKDPERAFSVWLCRSRPVPLHVDISDHIYEGDLNSSLGELMLANLHRIERFSWDGEYRLFNKALPHIPTLGLSTLQALFIESSHGPAIVADGWNHVGRQWSFPHLRTLSLPCCAFLLPSIKVTHHLQELIIRHDEEAANPLIPYDTWIALWRTCSQLDTVTIDLDCIAPGINFGPSEEFHCSLLRVLNVHYGTRTRQGDMFLFTHLHAPRLESLEFRGYSRHDGGDAVYGAVKQLVSCSKLQMLYLAAVDFSLARAWDLLRIATNVHTLSISSSAFITALGLSRDTTPNSWVCPKLRTLIIRGKWFSMADLVAVVSRRGTPSPTDLPGIHYVTMIVTRDSVLRVLRDVPSLSGLNLCELADDWNFWGVDEEDEP